MKKSILSFFSVILFSLLFASCSKRHEEKVMEFFDSNKTIKIEEETIGLQRVSDV